MLFQRIDISRRRVLLRTLTAILAASAFAACGARRTASLPEAAENPHLGTLEIVAEGGVIFDGPVQDLFPCHDGDVIAYRVDGGPRSGQIMVSRIFALPKAGDFRVANSFGDTMTEGLHLRIDSDDVLVVSQIDAEQDSGVTYARPLPLLSFPVKAGINRFHTPVRIWRPSNGRTMGEGEVSLDLSFREDSIQGYDRVYAATQVGAFKMLNQSVPVESTAWMAPGLGEVRGERVQEGNETETFTLVCARISGKEIVDCDPYLNE
jgi:hypothetical protein